MRHVRWKPLIIAVSTLLVFFSCNSSKTKEETSPADEYAISENQQRLLQQQKLEQERIQLEQLKLEQEKLERERIQEERLAFQRNIQSVLEQDASTEIYSDVRSRVTMMRAIGLSACPPDFAAAYMEHIHAWDHFADAKTALQELHDDGNIKTVLLAEGISQLLGLDEHPLTDAADAETRLNEAIAQAREEIRFSWEKVERLAVSYGVALP